jgi:hypothetical protein
MFSFMLSVYVAVQRTCVRTLCSGLVRRRYRTTCNGQKVRVESCKIKQSFLQRACKGYATHIPELVFHVDLLLSYSGEQYVA